MGRQWQKRRRPHQLVWTWSLTLGFLASLFYALFLLTGNSATLFKLYYIAGGLLMAAYLGLGSIYLLAPRRWAQGVAVAVVILSVAGVILLAGASIDPGRVAHASRTVGPGTNAVENGAWKVLVAVLNSFGALAVIGGAVYSGYRTYRWRSHATFLLANVLIAAGTFLAALAGTVADLGAFPGSFWVILAAGFGVLYAGFVLASRPAAHTSDTAVPEAVVPAMEPRRS